MTNSGKNKYLPLGLLDLAAVPIFISTSAIVKKVN